MRIVFMGTPDFAVPCLIKLIESGYEIVGVVTQPDRPKDRGMQICCSPIKECAEKYNIPVFQPEKIRGDKEFLEMYKSLNPELAVVVAFGQILPKEVLEVPLKGCINVHGSLLPKYRGSAPIQWAVINGEKVTGVTTMFMDEGMDTGDMILKKETEIGPEETSGELYERLKNMGAELLKKTVEIIEKGNIPREKQSDNATYAPMLKKETGKIDWNKTTKEIYNLIKGVNPWPGAYSELNGTRIKVYKAIQCEKKGEPGEIIVSNAKEGLVIATSDSSLSLIEIQPDNKKRMTAKEYLLGHKIKKC